MAVPTRAELNKKAADLDKLKSKLLDPETGKQKETALVTLVRSAIRSSWAISPVKLAYYEMGRVPDNTSSLRKWQMQCECCEQFYKVDEIEIDHKHGNHSFKTVSDFEQYFDNILDVTFDDLQRICKYKCHRVKSHMEKQGLPDMHTACLDKINIFVTKFTAPSDYTRWLAVNKVKPETSAPKRKAQGLELLTQRSLSEKDMMDLFEACDYLMRLEAKAKKSKRFVMKQADYVFVNRFYEYWGLMGINRPKLNFTKIEV